MSIIRDVIWKPLLTKSNNAVDKGETKLYCLSFFCSASQWHIYAEQLHALLLMGKEDET